MPASKTRISKNTNFEIMFALLYHAFQTLLPAATNHTGIDATHTHIDFAGDVAFRRLRIIAHQAAVVGPNLGMNFAFIQVDRQ